MSRQRIVSRLIALESQGKAGIPREVLAALAEQFDLDEGELWTEAERLATLFHREGLTTWDQHLAHIAWEMGITVEALQADVDAILAVSL